MSKEAMKLALEALESCDAAHITDGGQQWHDEKLVDKAITALREALAKPDFWEGYVPEPVKPAQQEPVHQFRKSGCSDWYDGHPDHTDGGGPYEARTLYTSQLARHGWTTEQIAGMVRLKESQDKKLSQRKWVGPAEQEALDKKAENARELGLDYEPVCNKDPQGCWNVRCQLGKKCKEQPAQQEPVAYLVDGDLYYPEEIDWESLQEQGHTVASLYTSAQRTWVGLTNNELQPIADEYRILFGSWVEDFARAIEAKLKEKNT